MLPTRERGHSPTPAILAAACSCEASGCWFALAASLLRNLGILTINVRNTRSTALGLHAQTDVMSDCVRFMLSRFIARWLSVVQL